MAAKEISGLSGLIKKAYDDWPGWRRSCEHFEQWGPMEQTFEAGFYAGYRAAHSPRPAVTRWDADFSNEPYMKVSPQGEWVRFVDIGEPAPAVPSKEEKK